MYTGLIWTLLTAGQCMKVDLNTLQHCLRGMEGSLSFHRKHTVSNPVNEKDYIRYIRSPDRVVQTMIRRFLSGRLISRAPRMNEDESTPTSRPSSSSFTSTRVQFTSSPLGSSRRHTSTQPATTDDDNRALSQSTMPSRLRQDHTDPTMADTWSLQKDAKLNRGYTLIDNDTINEQDYEIIPNIKTTLVETNPRRPPHPLDHYAHNRSYIRKLAERMDYWDQMYRGLL
jgi:hypothetical protein